MIDATTEQPKACSERKAQPSFDCTEQPTKLLPSLGLL